MAKKRQCEDSEVSDTPAKKEKEAEFNGTSFKAQLKEPTKAMKGLQTFILTAKKLPCPDLYDVVEGYIKISMECAEIFNLLEGEHIESKTILIFESLEMILLRTASDLSHFSMVGTTIVKKMVSSYMKLIQGSLYSENHRFVRQCLSFLSAMVSQGPDTAREVFKHIQFSKSLSGLLRRKDKMGGPDVRMAYIKFALSFLVSGDNTTVGQLLEIRDFLPDILNSGLKEDRISLVNLILSTLQTRVVQSKAISKTQKVRFFNPTVLADIASLYKWNGIVDASTEEGQATGSPEEAGQSVVRELVHNFLLDLCCSRKHGLSFYDPSFGTAGRVGNIVLLAFVVGLRQATEDELVGELVVRVLNVSPDILPRYFKETNYTFTPRLKSAWQHNVTLLRKIYEAQPEVSKAFRTRELIPLPRLLSMVMVTSLPPVCNRDFFTQGLNFANMVVKHTTLSMMSFILKRAQKNMEYCLNKSVWQTSDIYTPAVMEDFVQLYREALSKALPDLTTIVFIWQSLTKKDKGEEEGEEGKKEKRSGDDTSSKAGAESAEVVLLKALLLQVMCLYQRVVPHLVNQSKFDFSKLLKGIVSEKGMREEVPHVLQYQILQLALDLPASKFSWFRLMDSADTEAGSGEKSVFYLLLKMFVSSNHSHLKTSTRMLVLKVLKDSGVFEYTWAELELWLSHLARLDPAQQETVICFLERVLVKLVCNPYVYTDKVASLVQEAAYLQANLSGHEADAASIPISHIDDVLDMVDVIMETSEGDMEDFGPSLSDDLILQTFPFSAVVPAVLEARNKLPATFKMEKGEVYEYVASVLSEVLHCQRDPLALCLALLQCDKELGSSGDPAPPHPSVLQLHQYYSRWLPKQSQEQLFESSDSPSSDSLGSVSFTAWMKAAYMEGASAFLDGSFRERAEECLSNMSIEEFPVAVKQVLLYIKSTVDGFTTFSEDVVVPVVSALMGVLRDLVTRLQSSPEAEVTEPMAVDGQEGADLFLDVSLAPAPEDSKDLTLLAVLKSILKHPCLEQWFLSLELSSLPPHALNPVRLKRLCAQLSDDTLSLLQTCAPSLRTLDALEVLGGYLVAVERAVLRELERTPLTGAGGESRPIKCLLALHDYMDSSHLKEVVSALLLLPQESLIVPGGGGGDGAAPAELGAYGRAALRVLTESSSSRGHGSASLSQAHLRGLGTLLLSCSSPALEAYLLRALEGEPGSAKLVHAEVLRRCLQPSRPPAARAIGSLLLQNCSAHRLCFELWCLEPAGAELLSDQTEDFLPLVNAYLRTAGREDPARPKDVQTAALTVLKQTLLPQLCVSVLVEETGDSVVQRVDALASLVKMTAEVKDIQGLVSGLPEVLQRVGGFERWQLVDVISDVLTDSPEEQVSWRKSVLNAALKWLISSYGQFKEKTTAQEAQEDAVLKRLLGLLTFRDDITASEWNSFVKAGLKCRYRDPPFLSTLDNLLELMYAGSDAPVGLVPPATLHMMISSHSLFLPTMLGSEDLQVDSQVKEALLSLLLTLVKKCPGVCNANHFAVLLGAYGATLSTSDQKLLLLLQEYEKSNISLIEFQSLLWGPAAVEHHKARRSLGASLWQQPSSEDLLALLSVDRMLHTIAHFPQRRTLIMPKEGKELVHSEEGVKDLGSCYDPCFLLPLFSAMLRPESVIDCFKFVSSHALGMTVVALSSFDSKLRAAAYLVLGSFYQHLEGAQFREKRQLLYLMDMVKNGIRQQNCRLPFVLTSYIAKVAQQMLKPEDHMYVVVNKFLLSHQSLDIRRVPEFFKLFYSFDLEHKLEREWILGVLEEGLTDKHSYDLCNQQGIFQTLLGFSSSPLCDKPTQAQIVRVLHQAAHVTKAAYNLTNEHGLLTWVLQVVQRRHLDQAVLSAVIHLLHVLWFTNLGQKEGGTVEEPPQKKCLPLPLISDFLCVSSSIIRHLRRGAQAAQLSVLLQTLSSVLRHRAAALGVRQEAGWLSLRPQALSCTEALSLLHCYGSLARDADLLTRLQGVAEKHQVKELLGTAKDKGRGRGWSSHARGQADGQAGDAEGENQEQAPMEGCKPQLRSIFTHWEPVSAVAGPQNSQPQQQGVSQDCLVSATAHLLTKWSLRSLVEETCDESTTVDFLQWFQRVVIPHKAIVEILLQDPAVKVDLIRLHHMTFEAPNPSQSSSRLEALQLLTSIMTHLLEVNGCPSEELHQAVMTACLTESTHDQSRKEAGLMLLSLYIHEMWSGAKSPALFLTHVKLVTGAEGLPTQVPANICNDIVQSIAQNFP